MLLFCARSIGCVLRSILRRLPTTSIRPSSFFWSLPYLRNAYDEDSAGKHLVQRRVTHSAVQGTESQMLIIPGEKLALWVDRDIT